VNVYEAITQRKSVRSYREQDVPEGVLTRLLEAARLAPSANNRQEWRFVVVRDADTRWKLGKATRGQDFIADAPVILACCAETDGHVMTCGQVCYPIDVAIAIDHITLCAVEEGLGTCWIGAFYEDKVKEVLGIPEEVRVVELLSLGYAEDPAPVEKSRLSLDEIVRLERWS